MAEPTAYTFRLYIDGKQKSYTLNGKKVDAERFLNELLHKLEAGTHIEPSKMTLGEYLEYWLENIKPTVRPTTHASYSSTAYSHIIPLIGKIPVSKLTPLHIQQLITDKQNAGSRADSKSGKLSSRSVSYIRTVLNIALGQVVKWQLLQQNVALAVEPPKQDKKEFKPWNAEQSAAFLKNTSKDRLYPLYLTAVTTGLRRGELLGLRWQDINSSDQANTISVNQTIIVVNGKIEVSSAKTVKGQRTIAISPLLAEALREHKRVQDKDKDQLGSQYHNNDLVFPYPDGRPMDPNLLTKTFKRAVKAAKLPSIRLHDVRHGHATLFLAQGENPRLISERLGHASVSFTLDTYAHSLPGQQEKAVLKLDEQLFRQNDNDTAE